MPYTRREDRERCLASHIDTSRIASLSALATALDDAGTQRQPTPFCELGPFYKRGAPHAATLRGADDPGMPLAVSGVVYDVRGAMSA